jgi:capsid protein
VTLNQIGHPPRQRGRAGSPKPRHLRARFDNAATTDENRNSWANADALAPDSLGTPGARRELRNRSRYECRNNSWAKGIKDTLANDCVGTGPRLQMLIEDTDLKDRIEADFWAWCEEVRLPEKLRTMRASRVDSGEVFGLIGTNASLVSDVKLDLVLAEAERVTDPYLQPREENADDGIRYDANGNPMAYWVLDQHPGDTGWWTQLPIDGKWWASKYVLHYYRPDRPGQRRGIPDITPSLDQVMELRRYSKAVIAAAETAADVAAVLYSDAAPTETDEEAPEPEAMDQIPITRRVRTTLPQGWKLGQFEAEQPTTTYKEFVDAKLSEIARCLQVPFFIAALDSASTNMSAAYVVGQKYARAVAVDRSDIEVLLNRLLDVWLTEWLLVNDRRRSTDSLPDRFNRVWQWDEVADHADPQKRANAIAAEVSAGVSNRPREYARKGLDWEDEDEAAAKSFGMTIDEYRKRLAEKAFGPLQPASEKTNEDDEEPAPNPRQRVR